MAWSVDQIYQCLQFLVRKNQSAGIRRTDLFYTWNMEQSAYQSDLLGRFQKAGNGKEGINTGLIENEVVMTKLAPFTQTTTIAVSGGQAIKPSDFVYSLALRINNAKVFQVDHDQIWAVLDDVIDPPSITDDSYYYTEYQNYYSVLPSTVTDLTLDYVQVVTDIVWNFSYDANNNEVYNPVGSVQPLWGQNSIVEITQRCLKSLGVSFSSQDFEQFGESKIQTGD
jgi:hypothetical protein